MIPPLGYSIVGKKSQWLCTHFNMLKVLLRKLLNTKAGHFQRAQDTKDHIKQIKQLGFQRTRLTGYGMTYTNVCLGNLLAGYN